MKNIEQIDLWGARESIDLSTEFRSCIGYAKCPGWAFIQNYIENSFGSFKNLEVIELGCGLGKVSLLFNIRGAKTTLLDYSEIQINKASILSNYFEVKQLFLNKNLLELPVQFNGKYDVSMSFGTAEHFFDNERQEIFNSHWRVLRDGGLSVIWVPNKYGIFFHSGVFVRRLLNRPTSQADEIPFTRNELILRAKKAGYVNIKVVGGDTLHNDFQRFIINYKKIFRISKNEYQFKDAKVAKSELQEIMVSNRSEIKPWNNYLSYPLMLIAMKRP